MADEAAEEVGWSGINRKRERDAERHPVFILSQGVQATNSRRACQIEEGGAINTYKYAISAIRNRQHLLVESYTGTTS